MELLEVSQFIQLISQCDLFKDGSLRVMFLLFGLSDNKKNILLYKSNFDYQSFRVTNVLELDDPADQLQISSVESVHGNNFSGRIVTKNKTVIVQDGKVFNFDKPGVVVNTKVVSIQCDTNNKNTTVASLKDTFFRIVKQDFIDCCDELYGFKDKLVVIKDEKCMEVDVTESEWKSKSCLDDITDLKRVYPISLFLNYHHCSIRMPPKIKNLFAYFAEDPSANCDAHWVVASTAIKSDLEVAIGLGRPGPARPGPVIGPGRAGPEQI
ncbi:unnamed protein product [Bursaphelenchus xylophilus]|uniref:(pine wood nematode) hypothetical protein n=1 Tax=Bursaphelenchus xylophilus TaxID=6326 RepID=A0A7I8XDF9_BURXY|nr:unnamed protein product [Bursaphelenchus xylophilus]CAG9114133.1 unnamed protein product [Bursaphelenchus xylophilus]